MKRVLSIFVIIQLLIMCCLPLSVHAEGSKITPAYNTADDKYLSKGTSGGSMEEFYKKYLMPAYKCYLVSGLSPALTLAQLAEESGWGSSKLARTDNNYWGMKCNYSTTKSCKGHGVTHTESGYYTDSINSTDTYRKYATVDDAFLDRPAFFFGSQYYPNITEMMKTGECRTADALLSPKTQSDWSNYCNSGYRNHIKELVNTYNIHKLDDEAYLVGLLERLGLYKNGDPIKIGDKTYYPGCGTLYTGELFTSGSTGSTSGSTTVVIPTPTPKPPITYSEWAYMMSVKDKLDNQNRGILFHVTRVAGMIFGVLIMIYGILLLLAYFIDIFNNFADFSLFNMLTFKRLYPVTPESKDIVPKQLENGQKVVSIKDVVIRVIICFVVGILFCDITNLYTWLCTIYYWVNTRTNLGV